MHETKGDEHSAVHTVFKVKFHNCNKRGHMAKNFPEGKIGREPPIYTPSHGMRLELAPAHSQAHYPIITPPTHFSFHNSLHILNNPQHPTTKLKNQPDFYFPRYQEQPIPAVKARIVEIGPSNEPKQEISVKAVAKPTDRKSIYDTGASHSLTGEVSLIFQFRKLTRPIPLSVATNIAQRSFVTGAGSLIYPGYNGKNVIVNGMFYWPHATGTLISPGALINSGAKMSLIGCDMLISGKYEGPLLRDSYNEEDRKWLLPLFSRLLAHAIDDLEFKPHCAAASSAEGTSIIHTPHIPVSAVTVKTHNKKKERI
ncbi:hypothetical protein O181_013580 [Austropuccinia psidii MF-1]|uniref:Uncharacterized protein n=1 Tax=Austropuccinia psidii MF-1 TaxID=1389203 RepID=A0A9Q3C061_9BASI|nr:hypothetical protein [Austropuccinia psidii MF-1]